MKICSAAGPIRCMIGLRISCKPAMDLTAPNTLIRNALYPSAQSLAVSAPKLLVDRVGASRLTSLLPGAAHRGQRPEIQIAIRSRVQCPSEASAMSQLTAWLHSRCKKCFETQPVLGIMSFRACCQRRGDSTARSRMLHQREKTTIVARPRG